MMAGWFPGWPGPIFAGGRPQVPTVSLPALPVFPGNPGVPVAQTQAGHAFIQAGGFGEGGIMLPPELPGMPRMPGPPDDLFTGGPCGGGLFRPVSPVASFDQGNQVHQIKENN